MQWSLKDQPSLRDVQVRSRMSLSVRAKHNDDEQRDFKQVTCWMVVISSSEWKCFSSREPIVGLDESLQLTIVKRAEKNPWPYHWCRAKSKRGGAAYELENDHKRKNGAKPWPCRGVTETPAAQRSDRSDGSSSTKEEAVTTGGHSQSSAPYHTLVASSSSQNGTPQYPSCSTQHQ